MSYRDVWAKYDRAEKHIKDFRSAVAAFGDANRDHVGKKTNEETGDLIYYLKSVPVIPVEISLILGDAIHNLHSSLDYLAHAIVRPVGARAIKDTKFPIRDTSDGFDAALQGCIQGARDYCLQIFRRIQPYQRGNGHALWQLHKLDIIDKHRLPLTASYSPMARTITPEERKKLDTVFSRVTQNPTLKSLSVPHQIIGASVPTFPMHEGQILASLPAADAQHQMGFSFGVALNEPAIAQVGVDAISFASYLSGEVRMVINDLGACATLP
ncbi:MAG TPA: hypothetical protein VK814_08545 [Acidobacteriaceae bacterium]|jgi:hypothetical protein|nr:hypothetical protein [Acidobacteriaceae bacterium]